MLINIILMLNKHFALGWEVPHYSGVDKCHASSYHYRNWQKKKINSDTKYMRDIYHDKLLLINPYSAAEGCQCLPLHSGPRTDAIEKLYGACLVGMWRIFDSVFVIRTIRPFFAIRDYSLFGRKFSAK